MSQHHGGHLCWIHVIPRSASYMAAMVTARTSGCSIDYSKRSSLMSGTACFGIPNFAKSCVNHSADTLIEGKIVARKGVARPAG
jgi:hypothetical protein